MKLFWKYCAALSACIILFTFLFNNERFSIERVGNDDVHLVLTLGKYAGSHDEYERLIATRADGDASRSTFDIIQIAHQMEIGRQYRTTGKPSVKHIDDSAFRILNNSRINISQKVKREINRSSAIRKLENIVILDEYGLIPSQPSQQLPNDTNLNIKNKHSFSRPNDAIKLIPNEKRECFKKILLWEDLQGVNAPQVAGTFFCPEIPCKVKVSYSNGSIDKIAEADAVILHHRSKKDLLKMITKRKVGQKWILATRESPLQSSIEPPDNLRSVYDWIMTYRQGADFSLAWGYFDRGVPQWKEGVDKNWASGKNRFLAWNKSNCTDTPSAYKGFVSRLNKYIPVSIPQNCRSTNCNYYSSECKQSIRQFKFVLALENSECKDYITESFWEMSLKNDVIPIVYGPPKKDYERLAPPHSFIHIDDFTKVADLAKYLKKLDNNDTLYNEYFLWKKEGKIVSTKQSWEFNSRDKMCEVARKLRKIDVHPGSSQSRIYENIIGPWWKGSCAKRKMPS
ncbi:alpha-(1,3)-fucosyltransferase 7-like [Anneissia japonica]|uniref:alpha-(1,3)-fucosyltransferase 7-like n=1 Tax=Anneissia japonica TaxID=1529436 RepID=UPI001425B99F|nr:alpha-(1,3)-fucosyltransferase 7-like [Anneissia japonica]XP_033105283.1 alpha-(1,3)-fucosyltransferase 7-like [Anneissia japonica]XP_033105284.1 alpha-(1,3)-fucosyltransferase 7-like [Anneissia japonica]